MFSIKVSGDLGQKFKIMAANLDTVDEALKQFSKYLRDKAKGKFESEGPGWPGLAQSTDQRLAHSFTGKFTVDGKLRKSSQKAMLAQIEKSIKKGKLPMSARTLFKKMAAGNLAGDDLALRAFGHIEGKKKAKDLNTVEKTQRKLQKLGQQTRDQRRAGLNKTRALGKHKMLGKLASSIKSKMAKHTLTVYSGVPWAGVHNEGGTGGKGARIPQRQFLNLDQEDLEVLSALLEAQLVEHT
jgi:hypothetical protein